MATRVLEGDATEKQKTLLAILAQNLGWDDDTRHARAGAASFNDLSKQRASDLITEWKALEAAAGPQVVMRDSRPDEQRVEHKAPRPRAVADIRYLSHSQISVWNDCGEKFRLYYVERVPKIPHGAFLGGIAIHDTIEMAYRQGLFLEAAVDPERLTTDDSIWWHDYLTRFRRAVADNGGPDSVRWGGKRTAAWPDGETFEWWQGDEPRKMLRRAENIARSDADAGVEVFKGGSATGDAGLEMRVDLPFHAEDPNTRTLTIRIDAFLMVEGGEPVIRDWTTGKAGGKSPMQAATYAYALVRAGVVPFVERGQYVYLRADTREEGVVDFDLRPYLPLVEPLFTDVERAVDGEIFPYNPGDHCGWCSVADYCAYGRAAKGASDG